MSRVTGLLSALHDIETAVINCQELLNNVRSGIRDNELTKHQVLVLLEQAGMYLMQINGVKPRYVHEEEPEESPLSD
jgi:hypothetical protein